MTDLFALWTEHLVPLAGSRANQTLLEIGVGDASSACWFLDNVLTSIDDQYIGIDSWANSEREVQARTALGKYGSKSVLLKGVAEEVLSHVIRTDLLYPGNIDICRVNNRVPDVISNLAWPFLSVGGVMFWDNYRYRGRRIVSDCVDTFLTARPGKYEVLWTNRQMGIRKTKD